MTKLLEKAVNEINKLPEKEQNEMALIILEEIKDEKLWEEKFDKSQDLLSNLADEALDEYKKNNTKDLEL